MLIDSCFQSSPILFTQHFPFNAEEKQLSYAFSDFAAFLQISWSDQYPLACCGAVFLSWNGIIQAQQSLGLGTKQYNSEWKSRF